jgi:hypothetical protein
VEARDSTDAPLLPEHQPQQHCSIDGPLFRVIVNATVLSTHSTAAADAYLSASGEDHGSVVMEKVSHIKPTSTFFSRSDKRTLHIATLGKAFWREAVRDLNVTCGRPAAVVADESPVGTHSCSLASLSLHACVAVRARSMI